MRAATLALLGALAAPQALADDPAPSSPAPVSLGAATVLTTGRVKWAKSLIDANGQGHVVVLADKPRMLLHFTLQATGEVVRELIDAKPPDEEPSIVMGADARLRVATGGHLHVQDATGWTLQADAPPCSELARAGDSIVCAFLANNTDPGKQGKWTFGIIPIGGPTGVALLPYVWYAKNHTLFVAREESPGQWRTLPLTGPADLPDASPLFALAGTADGTVHVLYSLSDTARLETRTRDSANVYIQIDPKGTTPAAEPGTDGANYVEHAGTKIVDYVPDGAPGRPCLFASRADNDVLLMVAGRSPYLQHRGAPAARHMEFSGLPCEARWGIAVDADHALHAVTAVADARASLWNGPHYYDLCYYHGSPGKWAAPVALGRASAKSPSAVLSSDGRGRVLITWVNPGNSLVARWVDSSVPANSDDEDADGRQRCTASRSPHMGVDSNSGRESSLPDGESAKATFEPVEWFGTAHSSWAQAKLLAAQTVPTGTVVVSERALYFMANNVSLARQVEPKEVRLLLADIESVTQESFALNHWISIRQRDGSFQSFKVMKGASADAAGNGQVVAVLQAAIGTQGGH